VSDVEAIGDNKLVMATGSRKRGEPDIMEEKAEEDIGQKGKQGEASMKNMR
jgi:hypothetical protein